MKAINEGPKYPQINIKLVQIPTAENYELKEIMIVQ